MKAAVASSTQALRPPKFLVEWQPWWPVFVGNVRDELVRRTPEPPAVTSRPAGFWPDVFVSRPFPWADMRKSVLGHCLLAAVLYAGSYAWWRDQPPVLVDQFANNAISYYKVSDYLPEIRSAAAKSHVNRKAEPAYAPQEIISVPPAPDNSTQTIINPPEPKVLAQNVPMPNIVAWTPTYAPPAATMSQSKISMPRLDIAPVAPPPDTRMNAQMKMPALDVTKPNIAAVEANQLAKLRAEIAIAELAPTVAQPKLEVASAGMKLPQLAPQPLAQPNTQGATSEASATNSTTLTPQLAQPNMSAAGAPAGANAGQLVALSITPTAPKEAIEVPKGSRSGIFAAGPSGTAGAPGIPASSDHGGTALNGIGQGKGGAGASPSGANADAPGISVSAPRDVNGAGNGQAGASGNAPVVTIARNHAANIFAAAVKPSLPPMRPADSTPAAERQIDNQVFGGRKVYQLQTNMPNLNSAGGSCVIRFAELRPDASGGELTTPDAIEKVDPKYPMNLMRDGVQGEVTLYAVIKSDGSVEAVRVLEGFDDVLDENARQALMRWRFRPAMRDGVPVDLEAVVRIPFRAKRSGF